MPGDILVLVEHSAGKIDSLSFQLLAIGQRLAAEMKVDLLAAAIGHRMENVVEALQGHGTDKILVVDDPALPLASAEVQAHVFARSGTANNSPLGAHRLQPRRNGVDSGHCKQARDERVDQLHEYRAS